MNQKRKARTSALTSFSTLYGVASLAWGEEEDELLTQRFAEGTKITQLAKLHSRTYGAIRARLIKLELIQK
ncbi:hypothetical protein G6M26_06590 [Agrobacterium tumefaciens]|nr:hypothetical protein [Agrobacterium tumefaciens]NTE18184.1 hypothetical protein [Agrobacterium tumefaciens]